MNGSALKEGLRYILNKMPPPIPWLYDYRVVRNQYKRTFGEAPSLLFPSTYNEKINHRKLFDRRPIYNEVCDKIKVKDYVRERLGEKYTPKTLHVYSSPDQFEVHHVDRKCVLKSNSGWGDIMVLEPGSLDASVVKRAIQDMLENTHGRWTGEWGFYGVKSKVFIEEFLTPAPDHRVPIDYKFYCFDGKVEMVRVMFDRFTKGYRKIIVDREGNRLNMTDPDVSMSDELPVTRVCFDKMVEVAETVARGWDFLRVDLYFSSGQVYVGELTVYPAAGVGMFEPEHWDEYFGSLWNEPRSIRTLIKSIFAETWEL